MASIGKKAKRWTFGIVPYVFDKFDFPDSSGEIRLGIQEAIDEWNGHNLNVRFKERAAEPHFILFKINQLTTSGGSHVGMFPGIQIVWAVKEDKKTVKHIMLHELGHALGLLHEVCRHDRDSFVHIDFSNIEHVPLTDYYENQFEIDPNGEDFGNYDYASIMHYSTLSYAIDKSKKVITKLDGSNVTKPLTLSSGDIAAVQEMYKNINDHHLPTGNLVIPSHRTVILPPITVDPPAKQITPPSITIVPPQFSITPPHIVITPPSISVSPPPIRVFGRKYYPPSIDVHPDSIEVHPDPIEVHPDPIEVHPDQITIDLPGLTITPPPVYI